MKTSSLEKECGDLLRQRVDEETNEERQDGENGESDDILLVFPPDEEDESLHRVDKPVEAGGRTTVGTRRDSLHLFSPGLSLGLVKLDLTKKASHQPLFLEYNLHININ